MIAIIILSWIILIILFCNFWYFLNSKKKQIAELEQQQQIKAEREEKKKKNIENAILNIKQDKEITMVSIEKMVKALTDYGKYKEKEKYRKSEDEWRALIQGTKEIIFEAGIKGLILEAVISFDKEAENIYLEITKNLS